MDPALVLIFFDQALS